MAVVGGLLYLARPPVSTPSAGVSPSGAVPEAAAPATGAPEIARAPAPAPLRPPEPPAAAPEAAAVAAPAAPTRGTLRIDADVAGAQVFIDRQFLGRAPVTADDLPPGTHRLNVEAPGFDGVAETIEVEPGSRDIFVRLREVRLDASIAVVHKHGVGSCQGQLVATPQGLRFDAAEGGDAFSVALADLETFEVNYLEKNLRVKVRGGRQYNFTDPDGNADRLFVFHRDVDLARERLAR